MTEGPLGSARFTPDSAAERLSVAGLAAVTLLAGAVMAVLEARGRPMVDLDVYRTGARQILAGRDLYRDFPSFMPFSYPPIAGYLLVPLALVPRWLSTAVFVAVEVACLQVSGWLVAREMGDGARDRLRGAWVATASLVLLPLLSNVLVGQVNTVLMALVLWAWLGARRRSRPLAQTADAKPRLRPWAPALGLGLAAGFKIIPAGYGLAWLLRGRWRELAVGAGTAIALTGLGLLLQPEMSWYYVSHVLADTGRTGGATYAENQGLRVALLRAGLEGRALTLAWLAAVAVVVLGAVWACRRLTDRVLQLLCVVVAVLLAMPVSWGFHWTWIAVVLVWLTVRVRRGEVRARWWVLCVGLLAVPWYRLTGEDNPGPGHTWSWWQHLLGNQLVLLGLVWLAVLVALGRRASRA